MLRLAATWLSVCCALVCLAFGRPASAQLPAEIVIRWNGDPLCPRSSTLEQELTQRLAEDLDQLAAIAIDVRVTARAAGGYTLSLSTQGENDPGERSVELASCAEAQRAAVLLIATALSPAPAHQADDESARPFEQASFSPWSVRALAILDLLSLPQLAAGPGLGLGYALPKRFRVWADARYLFARETEPSDMQRSEIDLFALALGSAVSWSRGPWSGGPLLELEVGALRGKAAKKAAGSRAAPWLSAWAGASLSYAAGRFGIDLSALAGVPFMRPEFSLEDGSGLYSTRPVSARIMLGLFVALGAKKGQAPGQ